MNTIPQQNKVDLYKVGHISQYVPGTEVVYSSMTARKDKLASVMEANGTRKMVLFGVQMAVQTLKQNWDDTFFSKPKEEVIKAYARRVKNCLGSDNGDDQINALAELHDLGYLPLKIKALPEGSLINEDTPFLTVRNTRPDNSAFYWLTNYCETFISCTVWPMCNSASISQQYYLTSKRWGEKTAEADALASWLLIANHDFSARGMRGDQDAMMSGMAHLLFGIGTDTMWAIDGLEQYYGADSDKEPVGVSVNAFEHATATQRISFFGSEEESLRDVFTNLYPRGILSYVADSKDYYYVISELAKKLKPEILARTEDSLGLPGKVVFRPDSSPKTPLEVICGDFSGPIFSSEDNFEAYIEDTHYDFANNCCGSYKKGMDTYTTTVKVDEDFYEVTTEVEYNRHDKEWYYVEHTSATSKKVEATPEVKGSLQILWEIFGGTTNEKGYKVLNPAVGLIYGEAISMELQDKIYSRMEELGFCVTNVLFGVGSWAKLQNSSRDSYGIALKGGYSIVNGEAVSMNKSPKTDMTKASREGLLRVELEKGEDGQEMYVTYDNQTVEQEAQGELKVVFEDGELHNQYTLAEIRSKLGVLK